MNIKDMLKPFFSRFVTRSEFESHEESLQKQIGQLANELRQDDLMYAGRVRQELDNVIDMLRQENQNLKQELANTLDMLRLENQNLRQELASAIDMLRQEDLNLNNHTASKLLQDIQIRIDETGVDLIDSLMKTRLVLAKHYNKLIPTDAAGQIAGKAEPFEVDLEKFKNLHPHLYDTWASVNFGINIEEFKEHPEASCGVETRLPARYFQSFVAPYLTGQVLDVGCGPYSVPLYLKDYPIELISGIDPLEPFEPHPFTFVRGFAEFLPWKDSEFDVLIAATSLDHVLSLDLALQEMRRVLKPRGTLLVWDWFGEKTEPYNPSVQAPQLIDRYHLFNFSEDWFEDLMMKHFSIEEKIRLYGKASHDRFYALRLEVK